MLGWVQAEQTQCVFEVGEALLSRSIQAKPLPVPFGDRVQRRVLQKLRGAPFDPGMRSFREPRVELLDEPRLAETRFANDLDELALARSGALPTPRKQAQFLFAADERRQGSRAASPPAAARADDAKELNRLGYAFEFTWTLLLNDEKPGDLPLDVHGDEHRAGIGGGLDARGDVRGLTENLAADLHDDWSKLKTDARG